MPPFCEEHQTYHVFKSCDTEHAESRIRRHAVILRDRADRIASQAMDILAAALMQSDDPGAAMHAIRGALSDAALRAMTEMEAAR